MKQLVKDFLADTPPRLRIHIEPKLEMAVELIAHRQGKSDIDEDAVVRAYILSTPRHLREGIEEVLTEHNVDLIFFRPVFDEAVITDGMLKPRA